MVFKSTADIPISKTILEQVVGQDDAVEIIKIAAAQKRHVLLIGEPGTGKSMLGLALAELLPKSNLKDVVAFYNPNDDNQPLIREVPAGEGKKLTSQAKLKQTNFFGGKNIIFLILAIISMVMPWYIRTKYESDVMFAAFFIGSMIFLGAFVLMLNLGKRMPGQQNQIPKVIVDNHNKSQAPFNDATGAHAGALLGDVLHDPFQSGGLGTPAHERIVAGMIHKSNGGVLFIDEVGLLHPHTQQDLLTALQEKKHPITGQSERSAGAMVRTEPVPCDFILVAAGNVETIKNLHPALRSRIRGYGYEIFMKDTVEDTPANRIRIARFVAQEVHKDKKIPHFSKKSVELIIQEARKRASMKGKLTLRLRELGGLIRAAGDIAVHYKSKLVEPKHIAEALISSRALEQQIADKIIERRKEYEITITKGKQVGRVNGLAVLGGGDSYSGIILPIEAEITPGGKRHEIIATGKLGEIAKEAITNVSAIIKKYFGKDIKETSDIYVQFLQTYEGVEGDSASIAVATAVISALTKAPVKQNYAVTGSLSVLGEVLPIGGVSAKIEAAINAGIEKVIIPKSNFDDVVLSKENINKIKIIPVSTIKDVLKEIIDAKKNKKILKIIK